jgi:hypothetical protein
LIGSIHAESIVPSGMGEESKKKEWEEIFFRKEKVRKLRSSMVFFLGR